MNQIDPETFTHLVELAALEMDASEAEYLRKELNHQLQTIDELAAIPLDENVEIAAHGVPYPAEHSAPPRSDEIRSYPDPATIIHLAPENDEGYAVVPDIPHTTLE
ncbi:MAG: aspartyl/glutamyl-tRNA amidotransferase subunit C [Anaerolineaceae bacterium]